ncbi:hypothetical protein Barb4_03666 [Bacteroidales bacterium Barb4]|nr:hypothetical protein Barb4_03666 [Bacteroidales bacterium Barb4]
MRNTKHLIPPFLFDKRYSHRILPLRLLLLLVHKSMPRKASHHYNAFACTGDRGILKKLYIWRL